MTKTPELLGRWLNRFVARVEPDQVDERMRRSLGDRYASVRPDLDGVSFLSACMSSLDAASVDLLLEAMAGVAEPGDPRTKDQRRADALVDLLLGRISNGWHGLDCELFDAAADEVSGDAEPEVAESGPVWDPDADWDLPASAFRPDPLGGTGGARDAGALEGRGSGARRRATGCHGQPPPRVTIGVVVSIQSLFGFTDTPGELADGSALVPAEVIRELAGQEGTLFYRLLTDPPGNLLDVSEMGRFPSRNLTAALRFRDGVCTSPICHVAAQRCDLDHVVPWPDGPTAAWNLGAKCRKDHRAKTHAGFGTTRNGPVTTWIPHRAHLHHPRRSTTHRGMATE